MRALSACSVVIAVLSLSVSASAQTAAPTKESTTLDLTSTIPGRELELRFVGKRGASDVIGGPMRTTGDTIFVRTPARLILRPDSAEARLIVDVAAGEPWLHASMVSKGGTMDAWGTRLEVLRLQGKATFMASFMHMQP
jgi:hypothetical protein